MCCVRDSSQFLAGQSEKRNFADFPTFSIVSQMSERMPSSNINYAEAFVSRWYRTAKARKKMCDVRTLTENLAGHLSEKEVWLFFFFGQSQRCPFSGIQEKVGKMCCVSDSEQIFVGLRISPFFFGESVITFPLRMRKPLKMSMLVIFSVPY